MSGTTTPRFDESKHPRDHGRFAPAGMGHNGGPPIERRTLARMPGYYRTASKTHGMPSAYTGSDRKELPVGSFVRAEFTFHKPKGVPGPERERLRQGLIGVINQLREPAVTRGHEIVRRGKHRGMPMIPESTPKRTINRAFNHAAMIGLHKYGVGHYDFQMDDALKAELEPLRRFMFYAQRRVTNRMHEVHTGEWKPYRAEFGLPFKDQRKDADGNVRRRVKPLHELIKAVKIGDLAKAFEEDKHKRGKDGRWTDDHPLLTGIAVGAGVSYGGNLASDAKSLVRGHAGDPGMGPVARTAHRVGAKLAAGAGVPFPPQEVFTNPAIHATKWRAGSKAVAATHSFGEGSRKGRLLAGAMAGNDRAIARFDALAATHAGFEKAPKPKLLWRGTHGGGAKRWLQAKPGDVVTDRAHASWTRDGSVATHFTERSITGKHDNLAVFRASLGIDEDEGPKTARSGRQGARLSRMMGTNIDPSAGKARVVLRGSDGLKHITDIEQATGQPGLQQEVMLGRGTKVRIDRVRDTKAGRVVFATALGQDPKRAYRAGVARRLVDPFFHAGRLTRALQVGLFVGAPVAGLTHGWLWGHSNVEEAVKKKAAKTARGGLAKAFEEDKHKRGKDGRFSSNGGFIWGGLALAAGAGLAVRGGLTGRRLLNERALNLAAGALPARLRALARGTHNITIPEALRHWRTFPAHAVDLIKQPTGLLKTPTGKQIRRQFARDSFMGRERLIMTDRTGTVLVNQKGEAGTVHAPARTIKLLQSGHIRRMLHNHPTDFVPSTIDATVAENIQALSPSVDLKPLRPVQLMVYGFGGTKSGKIRTRVTRYDHKGLAAHKMRIMSEGGNLDEATWNAAVQRHGSNYRTAFVEKLAR